MTFLGQISLLVAFLSSGYAASASLAGRRYGNRAVARSAVGASLLGAVALTTACLILAYALLTDDFRFEYVARHSSRLLPWHYALSALWVGQGGSLLLWAWFLSLMALVFRLASAGMAASLRETAFSMLQAYLGFLSAVLVFAADPMSASLAAARDGDGFSPLLLHPAMLLHPPLVFLGYAACSIPVALAAAALVSGPLDDAWARHARNWTLLAWIVLGIGILLGAQWAYEELGWGGYWAWDPVENASFIPWLTCTALIHCLMAWQYRGVLKKTAIGLAVATFVLCNFATFVTRSGIFSSLHAFSQSAVGWMFLALLIVVGAGTVPLVWLRRRSLNADRPIESVWSRESLVAIATVALLLLSAITLLGTVSIPLSGLFFDKRIVVGVEWYNRAFVPVGLVLLATTAASPLVRWGAAPNAERRKALGIAAMVAGLAAAAGLAVGVRQPLGLAVGAATVFAIAALVGSLWLDAGPHRPAAWWRPSALPAGSRRRRYAGFLIHMGLFSLAIGIAGSSLGTREQQQVLTEGEAVDWAGKTVRLIGLQSHDLPDRTMIEAELEVTAGGSPPRILRPARHYYRQQRQWTTEVAIASSWTNDFYVIPREAPTERAIEVTLIENPMMAWLWAAGWLAGIGACLGLWPSRKRHMAAIEARPPVLRRPRRAIALSRMEGA